MLGVSVAEGMQSEVSTVANFKNLIIEQRQQGICGCSYCTGTALRSSIQNGNKYDSKSFRQGAGYRVQTVKTEIQRTIV
jgi:hypothetical protein